MSDYVKPDNAKFNQYVLEKFRKYEKEMEQIESRDCSYYRKSNKKCGTGTVNLFPYQKMVREFVNDKTPYRGLLIYHMLGSGKTFTAVGACENMDRPVIVILPAALKYDWLEHIIKYKCDKYNITLDEWEKAKKDKKTMKIIMQKISKKYKFVSVNASNSRKALEKLLPLDNHLIIIDECHHLSHQIISEGSKNGEPIYNMIMNAKNIKILMLSATPLVGDPYELAVIFNMLRGKITVPGESTTYELFPNSYKDFTKYFVDRKNNRIINKNIFQERINGLVTYYKGIKDPYNVILPTKIGPKLVKLEMSNHQWRLYSKFRERELDEERFIMHVKKEFKAGNYKKPARSSSTSYRNKSRQACDFVLPFKDIHGKKFEYYVKRDKHEWNKVMQRVPKDELKIEHVHELSPKIKYIYDHINSQKKGLVVIYSDFITFGVNVIALIFKANGWVQFKGTHNTVTNKKERSGKSYKSFAILIGDTEQSLRDTILTTYKHPDNKYGKNIRVLLVSSVAAEGFSLRNVREMHLLEPYWQDIRLQQVMGRAARICSHYDLPPNERNVTYYLYLMEVPKSVDAQQLLGEKSNETTDEVIYQHALNRQELLEEFLTAMKEIAIDCHIFAKQNFDEKLKKCIECQDPNSKEPVYYPDIKKHMKHGNSYCIPRRIDYLEGPIMKNGRLYIYDPFSNLLYMICQLKFMGKLDLNSYKPIIDTSTKDHNFRHDILDMEDIVIVQSGQRKLFITYNHTNLNAYAITKITDVVGHYDPDDQKIVITDKVDESQCFYKELLNKKEEVSKRRKSKRRSKNRKKKKSN